MTFLVLWFLMGRGKSNSKGRAHKRLGKHSCNVHHTMLTKSVTAESRRVYNITEA